ncbi:UNVERIFIED_ORG: hypothetical protein BCL66_13014 [Martelella mediterranea]
MCKLESQKSVDDETTPQSEARRGSHVRPMDAASYRWVIGLLPAPELPEKVAAHLAEILPDLLRSEVDERNDWYVEIVCDPLTGGAGDPAEILDEAEKRKHQHGWDFAISITDLPILRQDHVVVADAVLEKGVGGISVPATGGMLMYRRSERAAVLVLRELVSKEPKSHDQAAGDPERPQSRKSVTGRTDRWPLLRYLAPIRRIVPQDPDMAVDVRFVAAPRPYAWLRLLTGMVRANQPWTIFPAFKSVVAVAFATGAYGLIFPTLWQLSDAYGPIRLVALMATSMVAMVFWLIISHDLWEKPQAEGSPLLMRLYNAATVLTLSVAVVLYYGVLLALFVIAVVLLVPPDLLESRLSHAIGLLDYVKLAWLATSVATIAGALGSGLESDETVRNATYGYRQLQRRKAAQEETG